ncbi:MAG: hypothetical protein FWD40_08115, partial [Treponema sp.]|nr:hypothetical protein [Treponema sp.]
MGKAQVQSTTSNSPYFDQIWAILQETAKSQKETDRKMKETAQQMKETDRKIQETAKSQKETDRQIQETAQQMKETDRKMQETDRLIQETAKSQKETAQQMKETDRKMQETDRQMKETDSQIKDINKRFGEYSNRLGEITEYMIAPNLIEKFNELGHEFLKASRNTIVSDHKNKIFFEIDIFLENGDKAMLVEIKTNLTSKNIDAHIKRLEKMRKYSDLHGDKRSFLGAVAGVVIPNNIREQALNDGFYVIEPSGET